MLTNGSLIIISSRLVIDSPYPITSTLLCSSVRGGNLPCSFMVVVFPNSIVK